ncbi:glutathione S-transferase [Crepidotus variabilis]|uniref:Glutathione S-transferase n=1 Tax=Crepidotus variabilis TaxID=179855 RepID=A0A9P6ERN7_9AGAR|nr:glutathione S-transferase [Crepidotus variabilis]
MSSAQKPILVYTGVTPNGFPITILLEALKAIVPGFDYDYEKIDILTNRQKEPWFIELNPNGRTRHTPHYDKQHKYWFNPEAEPNEYSDMLQWLFLRHALEIPYAKKRYLDEAKRLYGVLDIRLKDHDFLAGASRGKYSIADIKTFAWYSVHMGLWVRLHAFTGIESVDAWPNVKAWLERLNKETSVIAGIQVPPRT